MRERYQIAQPLVISFVMIVLHSLPMFMLGFRCANYMIQGLVIVILVPLHPWNLIGLAPIIWGYLPLRVKLQPQMAYAVQIDASTLRFKAQDYPWDNLTELKVLTKDGKRQLHLTYISNNKPCEVVIEDSILNFDDLSQRCFYHYMAQRQSPVEDRLPASDSNTLGLGK